MNTLPDEAGLRLARRIHHERESRGWSLAQLADRSQVSKAAISKIERGETSPTAALLVRLAAAFDLTLAGLLLRAEAADDSRVSRAAEQPLWRDPHSGYLRRQVFLRADHPVEIVEVEMPPGQRVALPAASYARIRQAIRVLSGELVVDEGGERHVLAAGDCLGFGPPSDVVLANPGDIACTYLVVLARS